MSRTIRARHSRKRSVDYVYKPGWFFGPGRYIVKGKTGAVLDWASGNRFIYSYRGGWIELPYSESSWKKRDGTLSVSFEQYSRNLSHRKFRRLVRNYIFRGNYNEEVIPDNCDLWDFQWHFY